MTPRSTVLAQYLRSRRAQLDPAALGFIVGDRRVPGLRREEIAELAGISRDYYIRLEQGRGPQVSDQVLHSLATAFGLDEQERTYLFRIARPALHPAARVRGSVPVGRRVLTLLHNWSDVPAYVFDSNQDIVAINEMADLLSPGLEWYGDNLVLGAFEVVKTFPENEGFLANARRAVAALRFHGDPDSPRMREIVGELSISSPLFRRVWSDHHARPLSQGTIPISVEGSELVEFPWQILEVPGGFFMTFMPVEDGTRPHELLAMVRRTRATGRPLRGPMEGWPAR